MIIPITPMGKVRLTQRDKWLFKADINKVPEKYLSHKKRIDAYSEYSNQLQLFALTHKFKLTNTLENITFVLPIPSSWSKKKRDKHNGQPHEQKPDLDNLIKALQDILCEDDKNIHTYNNIRKIWGENGSILINEPKLYILTTGSSEDVKTFVIPC